MTKLLVTCAPKSGSHYLTGVLTRLGLDVGHERNARDAVVSCYLTWDHRWPAHEGMTRYGLGFDVVWHLVREPLRSIRSIAEMGDAFWQRQRAATGVAFDSREPIESAAQLWARWNVRIHKLPWTLRLRVEDADAMLEWALRVELGLTFGSLPDVPRDTGRSEHALPIPGWDDLGQWKDVVRGLAHEYGYKPDEGGAIVCRT